MADFWNGKEPCWDFLGCAENLHSLCPAYHNRDKPCWAQTTTQCRRVLNIGWQCWDCKVFNFYSQGGRKFVIPHLGNHSLSLEGKTDPLASSSVRRVLFGLAKWVRKARSGSLPETVVTRLSQPE